MIAADGIHSVVRAQFYPDEGKPRYSGMMMWRGRPVDPVPLRCQHGSSRVVHQRESWLPTDCNNVDGQGRQLINWVAEVEMPQRVGRGLDPNGGPLEDFGPCFADWHFDWLDVPAMLAATETILEYPMVDQDPLPRWTHGRVTLLGDAAHPMVPRGSNGAGQAILDAGVLASCLAANQANPVAGLQAYEPDRRQADCRGGPDEPQTHRTPSCARSTRAQATSRSSAWRTS